MMGLSLGSSGAKNNAAALVFKSDLKQIEFVYLGVKNGQLIRSELVDAPEVHPVSKTFENKEELHDSLKLLLTEKLDLPKGLRISVVLPSLYSSIVTLPSILDRDQTEMGLRTEVERGVLFKKVEPTLDWFTLNSVEDSESRIQQLVVGAYPKEFIDPLYNTLKQLGFKPVGLFNALGAAMKGLASTGTLQDDGVKRLICVLNEGVFSISVLEGFRYQSLIDVPISTVSFNMEHLMEDIRTDLQSLGDVLHGCQQCILIQNNILASTSDLVSCFDRFGEVVVVEQTKETLASLGASTPLYPCSIEALGATLGATIEGIQSVDFLPTADKNKQYINKVRKDLLKVSIGGNILALCCILGIWLVMGVQNSFKEMSLTNTKPTSGSTPVVELSASELSTVVEKTWLKRHIEQETRTLTWLAELPSHLPSGVWFDTLELSLNDKLQVDLKGGSRNSAAVQTLSGMISKPFDALGNLSLISVEEDSMEVSEGIVGENTKSEPIKTPYFKWNVASTQSTPAASAPATSPTTSPVASSSPSSPPATGAR
ncbi:MAG: hypothetical protein ACKO34_09235 [Vampirovibrionales bacterium]